MSEFSDDAASWIFSVVTITRNDRKGIEATWRSLASQTFPDFEWVVVDGQSTDGTADFVSAIEDERVQLCSEADNGIYDALNKGTRRARGRLVVYMNSGDTFSGEDVLLTVYTDHQRRCWRWAFGDMRIVDSSRRGIRTQRARAFTLSDLRLGRRSIGHQAVYFERELLERIGPYEPSFGVAADQELMLRAAREAPPAEIHEVLADYLVGGVSYGGRPDDFVKTARIMRRAHHDLVGGRVWVDELVTVGLRSEKWLRHLASRVRRSGGP